MYAKVVTEPCVAILVSHNLSELTCKFSAIFAKKVKASFQQPSKHRLSIQWQIPCLRYVFTAGWSALTAKKT